MFEVRANYPSDLFPGKDAEVREAAGTQSSFSGMGVGAGACMGRDIGWEVPTFDEAVALKGRLESVPDVFVRIREH